MKKLTLKNLNWYRIFMASMMIATLAIAIWVGVSAVQKSMKMKIGFTINPTFEVKIDYNGSTIFCNTTKDAGGQKVAEGYTLNGDTLTFNQAFTGMGTTFSLTIYNYSEVDLQVSVSGDNASATPIQIPAYNGTAISKDLIITATGTTATLEFAEYVPQYNLMTVANFKECFNYISVNYANCYDATSLVFDYWDSAKYSQFDWDSGYTSVDATKEGYIRLFKSDIDGDGYYDYYVLSEGEIMAPESCEYLFDKFALLKSLHFYNFNTSNVIDMSNMFSMWASGASDNLYAPIEYLDLSSFDTLNVTDMGSMFYCCRFLTTLDLSGFNTSNVTDMHSMFAECNYLTTLDLSNFNTSNVTNMHDMFYIGSGNTGSLFSLDLSSFDTSKVTLMGFMFTNQKLLTTIYVGDKWSTAALNEDDSFGSTWIFDGCTNLVGGAGTKYNSSHTDATYAKIDGGTSDPGYLTHINDLNIFGQKLPDNVTSLTFGLHSEYSSSVGAWTSGTSTNNNNIKMFASGTNCYFLSNSGEINLNKQTLCVISTYSSQIQSFVSAVFKNCKLSGDASYVFAGCGLERLDLSGLDTSNVTDMSYMFSNCSTAITFGSNFGAGATDMSHMFHYCRNLTSLDLSSFNTSNVTDMSYMFNDCRSLTTIYVGDAWSTANVSSSNFMFNNCTNLPNFYSYYTNKTRAYAGGNGYLTLKTN